MEKIHLAQTMAEDRVVWNVTPHGNYTVKTGYDLARSTEIQSNLPLNPPHGDVLIKNQVWNLPIMPKIKHFLW